MSFKIGDIIEMDGLLGVVIELPGKNVPEEHLGIWFGGDNSQRASDNGGPAEVPRVFTVPENCCRPAKKPVYNH